MKNIYKTKQMKEYLPDDEFNPHFKDHKMHINKHMVIAAGTGLGKSNFIVNYIIQLQNTFEHIYIFTKDPTESIYVMMKDKIGDAMTLESVDKVPSLKEIKKYHQSLIIFDDFITSGKAIINRLEEYSIMARKHGFTCIYLTQSYFATPVKLRQNVRYLTLLSLTNKRNLDMIISQLSIDVSKETIKKVVANATRFKMNVCIIDLLSKENVNNIFRRNFTEFYEIVDEDNEELANIQMYEKDGIIN